MNGRSHLRGTKPARSAYMVNGHDHAVVPGRVAGLASLPPLQREALILVGAAGMSYEEAAEIESMQLGTIKSRVNRARSRLVHLLGVDGAEARDYRQSCQYAIDDRYWRQWRLAVLPWLVHTAFENLR